MGVSMTVGGSPASCRASARAVRQLALAVEGAATGLGNVRTVAMGAWSGVTADVLEARMRRMVRAADSLVPGLRTFADGLDTAAEGIAEVRQEMERARSVASAAGIAVPGGSYPTYDEVALTPEQEGPRDHGELIITRARETEERVTQAVSEGAEAVRGLSWRVDSPVGGSVGQVQGPLDSLPDIPDLWELPDLPGLPDISDVTPMLPGIPLPLPDLDKLTGLSSTLLSLAPLAIRKRGETAGAIGHQSRDLTGQLKKSGLGALKSGYDQWTEDLSDKDLEWHQRLVRASTVGGLNLAGGAPGAYVCTKAVITIPAVPACAAGGRQGRRRDRAGAAGVAR